MKRKASVDLMVAPVRASLAWSALWRAARVWRVIAASLALSMMLTWPLSPLAQVPARSQTLTVLSSLPEAYARARVFAFERANPDLRVELVNQRSALALAMLRSTGPSQRPDLIWSASNEVFDSLASEGLLQAIDADPLAAVTAGAQVERPLSVRAQHLVRIGLVQSGDSSGSTAAELPRRWQDLAQDNCSARLALQWSDRAGVAPLLIEVILQDQGWDAGWAMLAKLAANTVPQGAIGGSRISFMLEDAASESSSAVQPALTAIMNARLAIIAGSRDPRQAQRFIRFVSAPTVYPAAGVQADAARPSRPDSLRQYFTLDAALLERRQRALAALVDQTLVQPLDQLKAACRAIDQASRRLGTRADPDTRAQLDQARALSFSPILSEPALRGEAVTSAFSDQIREALRRPRVTALESLWASQAQHNYTRALGIATALSGSSNR